MICARLRLGSQPSGLKLVIGMKAQIKENNKLYSDAADAFAGEDKIRVYDFFCGCGGTSAGLQKAGMEIVLGVDFDQDAAATYAYNFPKSVMMNRDIRSVQNSEIERLIQNPRTSPILFSACAPCQPFSRQNRFKSEKDDRAPLLSYFHGYVERFRPDLIFVENVPGIQNVDPKSGPFAEFLQLLRRLDFSVTYGVLHCQEYGVPQQRKRLVLLASAFGPIDLPKATHGCTPGLLPYTDVRKAIGRFPPIAAGQAHPEIPNHVTQRLAPISLERLRATPEGGGRHDWPEELKLECHKKHDLNSDGYSDVYGRLSWSKPASTMTTRCISISNGRFAHPVQDRALTVREAAAIQTFDDDFVFKGSLGSTARQVGNAVPVRLAEVVGRHILAHVNSHRIREVA